MSNLLREKTGLESDGASLVGQAFGGKNPKLKVNNLQTESEVNVQNGIEQILRGIFQAIRNPRSHEKYSDEKIDADSIIILINYILKIIDKSKAEFSIPALMGKVFDPEFLEKDRYADLIVREIPTRKNLEVFIHVFRGINNGEERKLEYFFRALSKKMSEEEVESSCDIVSEKLMSVTEESEIRKIIRCLPSSWWRKYSEVSRLRIEGKLLESIRGGSHSRESERCLSGALGTWADRIIQHFELKDDLKSILIRKLLIDNNNEQDYVFTYFSDAIFILEPKPSNALKSGIKRRLVNGDARFYSMLHTVMFDGEPKEWQETFKAEYENFKEAECATSDFDENVPF